jgi:hypothetical protein
LRKKKKKKSFLSARQLNLQHLPPHLSVYRMGKVFFVELMHTRDVSTAIAAMRGQIQMHGIAAEVDFYVARKNKMAEPKAKPKPARSQENGATHASFGSGSSSPSTADAAAAAIAVVVALLEQNGFESGSLLPFDSAYAALGASGDDDVDAALDTVVRKLFRSPYKRFNGLQLVTRGSEDVDQVDKSNWAFRICRHSDRLLAMAAFVENLLRTQRNTSFNGACGKLLNATGFTRAELTQFHDVLTTSHVLGNIRLFSNHHDKNLWYFVLDNESAQQPVAPVAAPAAASTATPATVAPVVAAAAPLPVATASVASDDDASSVVAAITAALAGARVPAASTVSRPAGGASIATAAALTAAQQAPGVQSIVSLSRWPAIVVNETRLVGDATSFFSERTLLALACKGTNLLTPTSASIRLVALAAMEALHSPDHSVAADDGNTVRGRVYLFDLRAADAALRLVTEAFLHNILSSATNMIVCHDARHSVPALTAALRLASPPSCFDTMVAYRTLSNAHFVPSSSNSPYVTLQQAAQAVTLPPPVMFEGVVESANFWNGDLLDAQIEWAAESVRALIPLRARLLRAIPQQLEAWSNRFAASEARVLPPVANGTTQCVVGAVYRMYDVPPSSDGRTAFVLVPDSEVAEQVLDAGAGSTAGDATTRATLEQQLTLFLTALPADVSSALLALVELDTDHLIANLSQVTIANGQKPSVRWQNDAAQALPNIASLADVQARWNANGWRLDPTTLRLLPAPGVMSLHRISVTLDERSNVVMLNAFMDVQRDNVRLVPDLVARVADERSSIAVVGKSRQGQWSLLRGFAEELSRNRRVLAFDTSGCMAGFAAVGLMVERLSLQGAAGQREQQMARALQNYDPQVIVVDHLDPVMYVANLQLWRGRRIPVIACIHAPSFVSMLGDPMLKPMIMMFDAMIDVHAPFRFSVHDNLAAIMATMSNPTAAAALVTQRWRDTAGSQWLMYAQFGVNQLPYRTVALEGNFGWLAGAMAAL